jgi:hypothetical protein
MYGNWSQKVRELKPVKDFSIAFISSLINNAFKYTFMFHCFVQNHRTQMTTAHVTILNTASVSDYRCTARKTSDRRCYHVQKYMLNEDGCFVP